MYKLFNFPNFDYSFTSLNFKSKSRVSVIKLIAYVFDKDNFFNRNFIIERIADRFGLLSPILSEKDIKELIFLNGIKIKKTKILFLKFVLGRDFFQRLLIGCILFFKPSLITLEVCMYDFVEKYKVINLID
tara:strand:- start:447 stop:839 length:393 start_codon:yes stop_codon:yes gene_type:complete